MTTTPSLLLPQLREEELQTQRFFMQQQVYTDLESKSMTVNEINMKISQLSQKGEVSDGYHTFDELYEFRKAYNAALFNEWGKKGLLPNPDGNYYHKYRVHKSWRHHDGELCFGGGWFIVVAQLPTGQISNHYEAKDWDLFKIPEVEKALFPFDGHTPQDVLTRLKAL